MSEKLILDATCASRSIWFQKNEPHTLYVDRREIEVEKRFGTKGSLRKVSIKPDVLCSFTDLPFPDETFWHVVFDPPHLKRVGETAWLFLKYGALPEDWQSVIRKGFQECMRVLKTNGTLIFKWNEVQIPVGDVIEAIGTRPLYGNRSGKKSQTHWMAFVKFEELKALKEFRGGVGQ